MITAIGTGEGVALAPRDPRAADGRRRPPARHRAAVRAGERIEIDDALAAIDAADADAAAPAGGGATVTAALVGRLLAAAADHGVATQARLGAAAVRRLIGAGS